MGKSESQGLFKTERVVCAIQVVLETRWIATGSYVLLVGRVREVVVDGVGGSG